MGVFFFNRSLISQFVLKKNISRVFNFEGLSFITNINKKVIKSGTQVNYFDLNFYKNIYQSNSFSIFFLLVTDLNILKLQIIKKKKIQHLFSILISPGFNHISLPLVVISNSNIASLLKFGKKNKNSSLTQMLACFFIRKYLLLLYLFKFDLFLKNMVCTFPIFWRYIKTPSNNIYWNPLNLNWVFDAKLLSSELYLLNQCDKLEDWLSFSGWYFLSKENVDFIEWGKFKKDLNYLNLKKKSKWVFRYVLNWSLIQLQSSIQFGFKKMSKLKRLPRRHTKKIVSKLQTRFWVW